MSENQKFDKHFEEKIIQSLLSDEKYAQQMMDVIELKYFELSYTTKIAELLIEHYRNYETFPTVNLLESILTREEKDETVKKQCLWFLSTIKKKTDYNDLDYVKDKSLQFFKVKNFYRVLDDDVLPLLEQAETENGNFLERISTIVQKATTKGADRDLGYDYSADIEERFKEDKFERITTPWPVFNKLFGGGLARKKIVCLIGGTGSGKSQACIDLSVHRLKQGKCVVYYNFEMEAFDLAKRADANISGIAFDDICASKDEVLKQIKEQIHPDSKFIIKTYPAKGASVDTLRSHLFQLRTQDIFPELVIVDYATLLKSSTTHKEKTDNIEEIWMALKGLSQEFDCLVVSPVQANREGIKEAYIRPEHIAGCYAITGHVDVLVTITLAGENGHLGYGRAYIGKNRLGPTGGLYCYKLDGAHSKIEILEITDELEREIEEAQMGMEAKKQQSLADNLKKALAKRAE